MAELSRLDAFDPDVANALNRSSPDVQQHIAKFAADWAVARTNLTHTALTDGCAEKMAVLVAELDDHYFVVSDEREAGRATTDDVLAAFGRARAASAVDFERRGEPAEAIYEAATAVEDWSELRVAILTQVNSV